MKKKLGILFKNLCCSICKHEFDEDSITIKREENGLLVTNLQCRHCRKKLRSCIFGIFRFRSQRRKQASAGYCRRAWPYKFRWCHWCAQVYQKLGRKLEKLYKKRGLKPLFLLINFVKYRILMQKNTRDCCRHISSQSPANQRSYT